MKKFSYLAGAALGMAMLSMSATATAAPAGSSMYGTEPPFDMAEQAIAGYWLPSSLQANPSNCQQGAGMGIVAWYAKSDKLEVVRGEEHTISLYYENELVKTINTAIKETEKVTEDPGMTVDISVPWGMSNRMIMLTFSLEGGAAYTREGNYTVVVSPGCFSIDNSLNEEFRLTYTYSASDNAQICLDPAPGKVTDLSSIKVWFDGYDYIDYGAAKNRPTLTLPDGVTKLEAPKYPEILWEHEGGAAVNLEFAMPQGGWPEGKYTLNIGSDWLIYGTTLTMPEDPNYPGSTFEYYIGDVPVAASFDLKEVCPAVAPAEGNITQEDFENTFGSMNMYQYMFTGGGYAIDRTCKETIKLLFNGNKIAEISAAADPFAPDADPDAPFAYIMDDAPAEPFAEGDEAATAQMLGLNFGYEPMFTDSGKYEVVVPQGFFTKGSASNLPATYTYVLESASAGSAIDIAGTFTPADGTEIDLTNITEKPAYVGGTAGAYYVSKVSFAPENADVEVKTIEEGDTDVTATLSKKGSTEALASFPASLASLYKGKCDFKFPSALKLDEAGEYVLNIPEGFFVLGSDYSNAMSMSFTIKSSVTPSSKQSYTLSPEAGAYKVYPTVKLTYAEATAVAVTEGAKASLFLSTDTEASGTFTITAEGNVVTLTPDSEITVFRSEQTAYNLRVPAGSYKLTYADATVDNNAVEITDYKVAAPVAERATVTPAEGAYEDANILTELTFVTEGDISGFDFAKKTRLYRVAEDGNRTQMGIYKLTKLDGNKGFDASLTLDEGAELADGKYVVDFPAGRYYEMVNGVKVKSQAAEYNYTIGKKAEQNYTIVVYPDETEKVQTLEQFEVWVSEATSITFNDAEMVQITGADNKKVEITTSIRTNNTVIVRPVEPITTEGRWNLLIKANALKINGVDYDKEITGTAIVGESQPELAKPAVNPAEGTVVDKTVFNKIVLTAEEDITAVAEEGTVMIQLVPISESGDAGWSVASYTYAKGENAKEIVLTAETELTELAAGKYRLDITAGLFTTASGTAGALTYEWTYDDNGNGVAEILAGEGLADVYTLDGVCVAAQADAEALKALNDGIYIVRRAGKAVKVVIRK